MSPEIYQITGTYCEPILEQIKPIDTMGMAHPLMMYYRVYTYVLNVCLDLKL